MAFTLAVALRTSDPSAFWVSCHHVCMSSQESIPGGHHCYVVLILSLSYASSHSPVLSFKLVLLKTVSLARE